MTRSVLGDDIFGQSIILNQSERRQGTYIIGATGTGKSTLIENLIMQDIDQQRGVGVLGPHGDLVNRVIERIDTKRIPDIILLDIANKDFPFGLNLYDCPNPKDIQAVQDTVNQVTHVWERVFAITPATPQMMWYIMSRLTSVLFTVLLAAFAVTIPTSQVHAQPLWGSQHIAIPAYFAPSTDRADWDRTDQSSPTVRIVIINSNSGPGSHSTANPTYVAQVRRSQHAGLIVLGYVATDSARRALAEVQADIDTYYRFYHIDGIFLDQVTADCVASLSNYYKQLFTFVKGKRGVHGTMVILNPGRQTGACYATFSDILVNFEGFYTDYLHNYAAPSWVSHYPARRFWHIVHDTPATDLPNAIALSKKRNAGYVYVTPKGEPNPYDALPPASYFSHELRLLRHTTS